MSRFGPENGSLVVKTYREGVAATVDPASITLDADPRSLHVREGVRGVKPLTDGDREDIRGTIDKKVLGGQPISFRSTSVEGDDQLTVSGDLTMAGRTRPVTARLAVGADGHVTGTIPVTQSEWGIKPYRGLMGALKVRDEVEIVIDARAARPPS
jgi:polyisoprenoid-binding protein YceI